MGKIKLLVILIFCFIFLGLIISRASAETFSLEITGEVYHMITSPVLPEDPYPLVSLADDLGSYDKTQWRFFRYDPSKGDYTELDSPDWGDDQDFYWGRGYWIISRDPIEINIEGEEIPFDYLTLTTDGEGWNQIGNIYQQDFTIGMFPECNLWVTPVNPIPYVEESYQLNDPENPYTSVTVKEYAGGTSYTDIGDEPGEVLEKGKGYWLQNTYVKDVELSFDPAGLTSISTINATNLPGQDFLARVALQEDPPDPPPGIEGVSFSSGSISGGCFIATAAYSDYDHPDVQVLRKFRDRYLLTNSYGRMFAGLYYRYSPILVKSMARYEPIKALVRLSLMPVIGLSTIISKIEAHNFLIVFIVPLLGGFFLLKKGVWGKCRSKFSSKSKEGKRRM